MDDYAIYRPTGEVSLNHAARLVTSAITFARAQQIRKIMAVTTGLMGFESPGLAMRSIVAQEWARASSGHVCLAVVARPEIIDPHKFGVVIAGSAGLVGDIFNSEEDTLTWLLSLV